MMINHGIGYRAMRCRVQVGFPQRNQTSRNSQQILTTPLCGEILPEILDWLVVPSIFDLRWWSLMTPILQSDPASWTCWMILFWKKSPPGALKIFEPSQGRCCQSCQKGCSTFPLLPRHLGFHIQQFDQTLGTRLRKRSMLWSSIQSSLFCSFRWSLKGLTFDPYPL